LRRAGDTFIVNRALTKDTFSALSMILRDLLPLVDSPLQRLNLYQSISRNYSNQATQINTMIDRQAKRKF
jgi:hypothetical protein